MASLPDLHAGENADRRARPRTGLWLGVTLTAGDSGRVIPAAIQNLSATGFLAQLTDEGEVPGLLDVALPHGGTRRAEVVWRSGVLAGCTFAEPLTRADLSAARLRSEIRQMAEERGLPLLPDTPPAPTPTIDVADPDWMLDAETGAQEKWSLRRRLLFIGASAVLPWVAIGGVLVALI
ncbi:PilZ domain-containing protein [Croceibacterium sp. TMG7-5b_MA50]|uniref:PilZ domain-containing protein n=1 Tax=Croceibacterium sp. TMG7-5b_MA50 TaxID=3121290 RepID=UPI003221EDD9